MFAFGPEIWRTPPPLVLWYRFHLAFKEWIGVNKSELVKAVAEKTNMAQKDVEKALTGIVETIGDALAANDSVQLVGFGSFVVKESAARTGRNPRSGAELTIPARKTPGFRAGKQLKDRLA